MILYFNKKGQLLEYLEYECSQYGYAPIVGTTEFQIFAYFEDLDDYTVYQTAMIRFKRPDMQGSEYPDLFMTKETFVYDDSIEASDYFKEESNPYKGFLFDFGTIKDGTDPVYLLDTPGVWEASITLQNLDGSHVTGLIRFTVQPSVSNHDDEELDLNISNIMSNIRNLLLEDYVPYEGAIKNTDLGSNDLLARFLKARNTTYTDRYTELEQTGIRCINLGGIAGYSFLEFPDVREDDQSTGSGVFATTSYVDDYFENHTAGSFVPYSGATSDVNLGNHLMEANLGFKTTQGGYATTFGSQLITTIHDGIQNQWFYPVKDVSYGDFLTPINALIPSSYSSGSTYNVGDVVARKGFIYKCNTLITTPEAWNPSHWTEITLLDEIKASYLPYAGASANADLGYEYGIAGRYFKVHDYLHQDEYHYTRYENGSFMRQVGNNVFSYSMPNQSGFLALLSHIAENYNSWSATYEVGDYCVANNGRLYKCNTPITAPEDFNSSHWTEIKVLDEIKNISPESDSIPSFAIARNALTNINGWYLSNFAATQATVSGYQVYIIEEDTQKLTETRAQDYMEAMTGFRFLPTYNFNKPKNCFFAFADGTLWKPQYDSTNGLVLWKVSSPFVTQTDLEIAISQSLGTVEEELEDLDVGEGVA